MLAKSEGMPRSVNYLWISQSIDVCVCVCGKTRLVFCYICSACVIMIEVAALNPLIAIQYAEVLKGIVFSFSSVEYIYKSFGTEEQWCVCENPNGSKQSEQVSR